MAATMRTTLSFAWHVISNVLQILIVLYVFSRLQVRFEVIVVAILGLIYVTIQGIGFGIRLMMGMLTINVQKDLIFIRKKMGDNVSAREKEASATESKMTSIVHAFDRRRWLFANLPYLLVPALQCVIASYSLLEYWSTLNHAADTGHNLQFA
jgi:hypothetical protein